MKLFDASKIIFGVDEVGRGAIAGEVFACACCIINYNDAFFNQNVKDSKKISKNKRPNISQTLKQFCQFSIQSATLQEIETLNILQATMLAMQRAINELSKIIIPNLVIIDGNKLPQLQFPAKAIINGDGIYFDIAAASIIAKVHRDAIMQNLSPQYPNYHLETNMGYGTKQHFLAIEKYGLSQIHRKTFLKQFALPFMNTS